MSQGPSYQPKGVRFRGAADSGDFNDHSQQVFFDLTELFNRANKQKQDLLELRSFHEIGSHFAQQQLDVMNRELLSLREELAAVQDPGKTYKKTLFVTHMRTDDSVTEYERASIDVQHDTVTLPYANEHGSKLYLYDGVNNEYIIPNTLGFKVEPKADGSIIKENSFYNALTPDESTFWHRQYTYFSGMKSEVECQVTLTLPDDIISSRDVNTVFIHPYPLRTIDIRNVEYRMDGAWKPVPGFKPTDDVGNFKLCFSPTSMKEVRITLRQRYFIQKGNKNIFHIGIREIGVAYHDYQSGIGRFEIPVEFNRAFSKKEIVNIVPVYQNEESLSTFQSNTRLLAFKVYEVDDNGKIRYLNDAFPIQVRQSRILIKCIMSLDKNTRATPMLKAVELLYKGDS